MKVSKNDIGIRTVFNYTSDIKIKKTLILPLKDTEWDTANK
jgi:hypothetical protein